LNIHVHRNFFHNDVITVTSSLRRTQSIIIFTGSFLSIITDRW